LVAYIGHEGLPSISARAEDTYADLKKETKIASMSFGGERFIAQQVKPGSWLVLDRRHRELVGSEEKTHERAEQRAAALNAANARLQAEGHQFGRRERDELNVGLQTKPG